MRAMLSPRSTCALLLLLAGCDPNPAAVAYGRCVNAEAEAKFDKAAEACREAVKLDPSGEYGTKAKAKLEALAPHLKKKPAK